MRKALMAFVMAATVLTPVAAQAQRGDRAGHYQRVEQRNQERYGNQNRDGNREARQQRQAQSAPPQQQQRQAPPQRQAQAPQTQPAPVQTAQRGEGRRGDGNRGQRSQNNQRGWQGQAPQRQTQPAQGYSAQRGEGRRGDRGDRGNRGDSGYQRGWQGPNNSGTQRDADRYNRRAQDNAVRYGTPAQRRDAVRDARRDGRDMRGDRRDWRGDRRADNRNWNRDWNRGWRNDRRYDWQRWRYSNRNIYRMPAYYAPYRGWNYSRFSIGFMLQPLFYNQRYWIGDPWQYRLPAAPYGTQWVRYYNDVLLVDIYTGEVVDVIYDFFW